VDQNTLDRLPKI